MAKLTIAFFACLISVALARNPHLRGAWCGTGWSSKLVPDSLPVPPLMDCKMKLNFAPSCEKHDKCYDSCGQTQKGCDDAFLDNLQKSCDEHVGSNSPACVTYCKYGAKVYFTAVSSFGAGAFKAAQEKGCKKN